MAKMGRPRKEIDQAQFENLCALQCTRDEICAWFDVTDKTLDRWCKRTYGETFSAVFQKKRGRGVISVRRALYQNATQRGNTTAQIFWLKNHGGMSDVGDRERVELENEKLRAEIERLRSGGSTDDDDIVIKFVNAMKPEDGEDDG